MASQHQPDSLSFQLPLIFGMPSPRASRRAILGSIGFVLLASAIFLLSESWLQLPYFEIMTGLLLVHGLLALLSLSGNLFIIFRYFLLWILVIVTAGTWAWYGGDVLVAPFGPQFQTATNTRMLVLAGSFAVAAALAGWHAAMLMGQMRYGPPSASLFRFQAYKILFGGGLAVLFSALYVIKMGGFVGGGAVYAANVQDTGFEFGVFNAFHFFGVALLVIAAAAKPALNPWLLGLAIITLVPGLLAGSRADFLPQIFILGMLFVNRRVRDAIATQDAWRLVRFGAAVIALAALGYLLALFIALWRSGVDLTTAIRLLSSSEEGGLVNDIYGHDMVYLETGNMMLGGLYAVIEKTSRVGGEFLWGSSYLNYLLIAPPAFLGLPRPLGLEWFLIVDGTQMSQGGVFEIAEAYWNFGLLGCLLVPFLLSFLIGWTMKKGLSANSIFFLALFQVMGFMAFRAVWYQTFAYFRIVTVFVAIYILAAFLFPWLFTRGFGPAKASVAARE